MFLTQRHKRNGHLTQVEVDKMLRLVRHVTAKVPPDNAVPCGVVLLVKLLDVLLNIVLFHRLHGTVHCILLHFIRHICILDHCLLVRHVGVSAAGETKIIFRGIFHTVLPRYSQLELLQPLSPAVAFP
uniref:Uncharacterized protein n=1 Tax=Acanthochromis polyacanthus TaxID=80966 RepID=A0A3Q1FIW8_9TELE